MRLSILSGTLALACLLPCSFEARAATAAEAAMLKTTLTPLGGERAGNAAGTIPAWTGGYQGPGGELTARLPDPFASDRKLFSITAQNVAQYADRLPQGATELFKRYPETFRIDVYPTRRTAVAPQWVYDNTSSNATTASLIKGGNSLKGAFGGIPFPIPHNANEIMWNTLLYWRGQSVQDGGVSYIGTSDGKLVFASRVQGFDEWPYYNRDAGASAFDGVYQDKYTLIVDPAYQNGNATLSHMTIDPVDLGTPSWQYLPGQRRVRKSPNLLYDMPNFFLSGVGQFDEAFGFNGPLDEYSWSIVGKKEIYALYNDNRFVTASADQQYAPRHHYNPDLTRWELHRVWVIDATLAPGRRNVVKHRRLYVDEDTWLVLASDEFDASNAYWRFVQNIPVVVPDVPCVVGIGFPIYDFKRSEWTVGAGADSSVRVIYKPVTPHPDFFTPDNLAASGVR